MTKRYREQVEVTCPEPGGGPDGGPGEAPDGAGAAPRTFRWRGVDYRVVTVLGHWREDAGYWSGGGIAVPQRDLWRVEARNGSPVLGIYELVREGGAWRLDRVWD